MITCKECIERMYPDDPRVKSGQYHLSGCDYCDKPSYYREIENIKQDAPQELPWARQQWDFVLQIKAEVQGWREKYSELQLEVERLIKLLSQKETYIYK